MAERWMRRNCPGSSPCSMRIEEASEGNAARFNFVLDLA
jgi:hypothetical protein